VYKNITFGAQILISMKLVIYSFLILSALCFSNCKNAAVKDGEELNSDVVNNPATANGKADMENVPKFTFEKDVHDFGKIIQGEKVSYSFKFTNTGKSDLIINSANGSCGCTVPNYPKQPIPSGGTGQIDITFDSSGKQGKQTKTVTLLSNTLPNTTVLTILGEVQVPENSK